MTSNNTSNGTDAVSDGLLYHLKCEIIDYYSDPSGVTRTTNVYGTFTSLPVAKAAARSCLKTAGYEPSEFSIYAEKSDPENWAYGEGVLVYAKAPSRTEFRVHVDVTSNNPPDLIANEQGEVEGPLYYVMQIMIDYNTDRTGGKQESVIEGVYTGREEAEKAAYEVLLDEAEGVTRESFAEFDREDELGEGDWPFGEDVVVHAVGMSGENFKVEVKMRAKGPHKREGTH
jgi:hypothetical protein